MKILHITPHLGGGVGKAHAAIGRALPKDLERTFVLLEEPRDRRYAEAIAGCGTGVIKATSLEEVAALAHAADIVQFEFWNHPRLFECLARCEFPAMRSVFWSHISGLFKPVIQPGLITECGRFVFSSEASLAIPGVATLAAAQRQRKIAVINSGFGFENAARRKRPQGAQPVITYLGTVDFVKLHPGFFDAIDRLQAADVCVPIWGHVEPEGAVVARARTMRHPNRIRFAGQTADPGTALRAADILFYPLQPDHYGTAENALIEAMSLGLTPVVLANPAEMAIIRHGKTGFVGKSIEDCTAILQRLLSSPETLEKIGENARRYVAANRTPERSAQNFVETWRDLMNEPTKLHDFRGIVGNSPEDWFRATQYLLGETWAPSVTEDSGRRPSKGTLGHFASTFPDSGLHD